MERKISHELISRSLLKTITFRALVIIFDTTIIYLVTRKALITAIIVSSNALLNTILYFCHERIWNKIQWGKKHFD